MKGVLLAAGALGLGSADAAGISRVLAAGGVGVDHFVVVLLYLVEVFMYDVRC